MSASRKSWWADRFLELPGATPSPGDSKGEIFPDLWCKACHEILSKSKLEEMLGSPSDDSEPIDDSIQQAISEGCK